MLLAPPHYPPAVPAWVHLAETTAQHLADDGFEVSVFTTIPSYDRRVARTRQFRGTTIEENVTVTRTSIPFSGSSFNRVAGGLLFGCRLVLYTARRGSRFDVLIVQTVPPVAMGLFGLVAAKLAGAQLVYHAMDLHPEAAIAAGDMRDSTLARLMIWLDKFTMGRAAAVVVLSSDMQASVIARGHCTDNVAVINNYNPISAQAGKVDDSYEKPAETFRLLFAGNLGRFQNLEGLIDGFKLARSMSPGTELELCFLGDGVRRAQLEACAGSERGKSIKFWDQVDPEQATLILDTADLAVVSLASKMIGACYPSKVMTYLEAGSSVLAIVEADSELAGMVSSAKIGVVVEPDDPVALAKAIVHASQSCFGNDAGYRSRQIAAERFGRGQTLAKWSDLLNGIVERRKKIL